MPQINSANSNAYLVPAQSQNQEFDISLNGVTYRFKLRWNSKSNCWMLNIYNDQNELVLPSIPLVTGCDLLEQFAYLGLDGALVVQSTNNPDLVPSFSALGSTGNLFFLQPVANG